MGPRRTRARNEPGTGEKTNGNGLAPGDEAYRPESSGVKRDGSMVSNEIMVCMASSSDVVSNPGDGRDRLSDCFE